MAASQASPTEPADGVDLVDEDDARRVLLALLEQVAHTGSAHAHEHLHEVRPADAEERHARFAGDRFGQEGLARPRRADDQDALRNAPPQLLEFVRVFEELDDLDNFFLGLINPGHVGKCHFFAVFRQEPRAAPAERQRLVAADLHLSHQKEPERQEENERPPRHEERDVPGVVFRRLGVDRDVMFPEHLDQIGVFDHIGLEWPPVFEHAVDVIAADGDVPDIALLDPADELTELDLFVRGLPLEGEEVEQQDHEQADDDPKDEVFHAGIHPKPPRTLDLNTPSGWTQYSRSQTGSPSSLTWSSTAR